MEGAFRRLTAAIELFWEVFDADKFRTQTGHMPTDHSAIDPESAKVLEDAKPHACKICAEVEAHWVFSNSVGQAHRWFTGCRCHDHIWTDTTLSDLQKQNQFALETGGWEYCPDRGKRGWQLARGHWKTLILRVIRDVGGLIFSNGLPDQGQQLSMVSDRLQQWGTVSHNRNV